MGHAENSTSPLFFSPLVSRRDAAGRRKTTASSSACGLFPDFASHTVAFFFPSQSSHDSRQMERSFTFRAVLTFSGEKQHYPQIHFCRPPHRPRFPQDPAPLVPQSLSWLPADIAARHFYPFDSLFPLPILTIQRAKVVQ